MSNYLYIICAGHGGITHEGVYTTGEKKMYKFDDGFTIYEGQINRQIAEKLSDKLSSEDIDHLEAHHPTIDLSLQERVAFADEAFHVERKMNNRTAIFISIHSNSASTEIEGEGSKATGFEIFTSRGQTKSDKIAQVFAHHYMKSFPDIKFRLDMIDGDFDKEADYYVLRKTDGPAILIENLFFDNRQEAELLSDPEFQHHIAQTMVNAILEIEKEQPI